MQIDKNNVPADNQVEKRNYVGIFHGNGNLNVLFIGNSITRHEPKAEIGWNNDWGMAASKRENDYVHIVVDFMQRKYGNINYCIANCGAWEQNYFNDEIIYEWERAREFCADIIIIRLGENINHAKDMLKKEPVYPYYKKMVQYFCKKENVKVILTDLFWGKPEINDAIYQVANECNYQIVKLGDLSNSDENMAIGEYSHSGVAMHPGDKGMRKIAERIIEKLSVI